VLEGELNGKAVKASSDNGSNAAVETGTGEARRSDVAAE
jgi:hypothetical protein